MRSRHPVVRRSRDVQLRRSASPCGRALGALVAVAACGPSEAWRDANAAGAASAATPAEETSDAELELPAAATLPPLGRGGTSLCGFQASECEERCAAGNALSCARRARLDQGNPTPWWKKSCDLGYVEACIEYALLSEANDSTAARLQAHDVMASVCAAGNGRGCAFLAVTVEDERFAKLYAKRGCELGSSEACLEAAPNDRAIVGAMRGMLRGDRPRPFPAAQASLACAPPTAPMFAVVELEQATYCAALDGQKHGAWIAWRTPEDLAEGEPHGAKRSRAQYRLDELDGPFESWTFEGELASKGTYTEGARTGEWTLRTSAGDLESGSFERGQREGVWITTKSYSVVKTPYVRGARHGIETEEQRSTGKVTERAYVQGSLCDPLKDGPPDSKKQLDCAEMRRTRGVRSPGSDDARTGSGEAKANGTGRRLDAR